MKFAIYVSVFLIAAQSQAAMIKCKVLDCAAFSGMGSLAETACKNSVIDFKGVANASKSELNVLFSRPGASEVVLKSFFDTKGGVVLSESADRKSQGMSGYLRLDPRAKSQLVMHLGQGDVAIGKYSCSQSSEICVKGRITTGPEGGAVLVDTKGNPIGSIPDPKGLSPEQTGFFTYTYVDSQQEEITLIDNVTEVKSCRK